MLNIRPIEPSGVQQATAIAPPGRQTRSISSAVRLWWGANMWPKVGEHAVEARAVEGELLGVALDPVDLQP